MVGLSAFTWLAALFAALRRPGVEGTDRGDMGTAFGLDDSMAPFDFASSHFDEPARDAPDDWARRSIRRPLR